MGMPFLLCLLITKSTVTSLLFFLPQQAVKMKKNEIKHIRNKLDSLLSKLEGKRDKEQQDVFEALCEKYGISFREKEIIQLLLKGFCNREIAHELKLPLRTVEFHIINIYKKAGITKRYDLILMFRI
jgi:DNA-binding NarL/FixJ family response regulator